MAVASKDAATEAIRPMGRPSGIGRAEGHEEGLRVRQRTAMENSQ